MDEKNLNYNTAIYCRLSKDDEQAGDSVSIETQKMILENFCQINRFVISKIYVDDGYSGLNFNRPAFMSMIRDIENGNINLVVTKDLSRLGRDYIQTGYYTDIYFSQKRVRYIAVNDGIDTIRDDNDIAPFKNILNDMYAKDLSRKVKSAKRQRAKKGYYINSLAPYGYKVDPENHNHLIIDEEVAYVVKKIFELFLSGKNYTQIGKLLGEEKILSPCVYKTKNGNTSFIRFVNESSMYNWTYSTVKWVLTNQMYVGDMVNLKHETINYKTKERVQVPKEDQVIVLNTHEPIISRDVFEEVQRIISKTQRKSRHNFDNIFKNLIFCAECGNSLQLAKKKSRKKDIMIFRCYYHSLKPEECTHHHGILYEDLYDAVLQQINKVLNELKNNSFNIIHNQLLDRIKTDLIAEKKKRINEEIMTQKSDLKALHKDFANGKIDFDSYSKMLNKFTLRHKELMSALIDDNIDFKINSNNIDLLRINELLEKGIKIDSLNRDLLVKLVKRIDVSHNYYAEGIFQHDVTITFRF